MSNYKTFFFDCDGVILDSNKVKTAAFYDVALPFGKDIAEEFVDYHKQNGGISRFEKMKYLLEKVGQYSEEKWQELVDQYANIVKQKLLTAGLNKGIEAYLQSLPKDSKKYIVSGGAQSELEWVFKERNLDHYFDGIYGSPRTKYQIIEEIGDYAKPSLFFGDSRLDYEVARDCKMDFIFFTNLTEFKEWENYFKDLSIKIVKDFEELI